jgi:hypothetical protein
MIRDDNVRSTPNEVVREQLQRVAVSAPFEGSTLPVKKPVRDLADPDRPRTIEIIPAPQPSPVIEIPRKVIAEPDAPRPQPSIALDLFPVSIVQKPENKMPLQTAIATGAGIGSLIPGVGTVLGGIAGGAANLLGNLFSGPTEDTSQNGFNAYLGSVSRPSDFPTKESLVAMMQQAGLAADDIAAVQQSYSQMTGTAGKGDWRIAVTSTNPVTLKWFKGASESFTRALNAAFTPAPGSGSAVSAPGAGLQSSAPGGSRSISQQQEAARAPFTGGGSSTPSTGSNTGLWVGGAVVGAIILGFAISKLK